MGGWVGGSAKFPGGQFTPPPSSTKQRPDRNPNPPTLPPSLSQAVPAPLLRRIPQPPLHPFALPLGCQAKRSEHDEREARRRAAERVEYELLYGRPMPGVAHEAKPIFAPSGSGGAQSPKPQSQAAPEWNPPGEQARYQGRVDRNKPAATVQEELRREDLCVDQRHSELEQDRQMAMRKTLELEEKRYTLKKQKLLVERLVEKEQVRPNRPPSRSGRRRLLSFPL